MPSSARKRRPRRTPLTRPRVLRAALALADADGLEALSMRKLGQALGVEAMSLYNHVAHKDDLLSGIIDLVVEEIVVPEGGDDWKHSMRERALSAREALLRHPWAAALMESCTQSSATRLRYYDRVLGALLAAGFPAAIAHNAFLTLDSYIYGFVLHEISWPFDHAERGEVVAQLQPQIDAAAFPHLTAVMGHVLADAAADTPGEDSGYAKEFVFGLNLILDGFEQHRELPDG